MAWSTRETPHVASAYKLSCLRQVLYRCTTTNDAQTLLKARPVPSFDNQPTQFLHKTLNRVLKTTVGFLLLDLLPVHILVLVHAAISLG